MVETGPPGGALSLQNVIARTSPVRLSETNWGKESRLITIKYSTSWAALPLGFHARKKDQPSFMGVEERVSYERAL
jgi:hypothetical protein